MDSGLADDTATVPIEVQAAPSVQSTRFSAARRLAKQLLAVEPNQLANDARVVHAFEQFLHLVKHGNKLAAGAMQELQCYSGTPQPEPYFLEVLQAEANRTQRRQRGMFFTPRPVIDYLVRRVEALVPSGPLRIVDPACGAGVFLLAARELATRRPGSSLVGFDASPAAIEVTRLLLQCRVDVSPTVSVNLQCVNPLVEGEPLANDLRDQQATLVILGNPPYANYGRLNRGVWIDGLLSDYRTGVAEQKLNLTDDFIKFLRWGQHWIDQAGCGMLAMITSRTYLGGVTHRGMRRSLAMSFPRIEIVDLHGDGEPHDENVFGIRRGVAIGVFSKQGETDGSSSRIVYSSLRGTRAKKLAALEGSPLSSQKTLSPRSPDWLFLPASGPASAVGDEYNTWPRLDEIFIDFISGVQSKNDALFVDFDRECLAERMRRHLEQAEDRELEFDADCLQPYVVGPLDRRWIYYEPRLLGRARWSVMRHLVSGRNLALVFMRQSSHPTDYDHALVVDGLASDRVFYSRRGAPFVAPLWRYELNHEPTANFRADWVERCRERCGAELSERDLFAYLYAVLWSPTYRRRYLAQLQRDFPRIPLPRCSGSLISLATLGNRLIHLHVGQASSQNMIEFLGSAENVILERGFPKLKDDVVRLNRHTGFQLADEAAWSFTIGGHRVLQRWLSVRRGRMLSPSDFQHVARIQHVATESQRLMKEIDAAYQNYWPG